ncbi:MAG: GH92 family glycosyl hydrolase, partial [Ignavibacteriales bacterium]|nr:GH92 family glycosyl hydrolase [Ignavibacteriales bacterium]
MKKRIYFILNFLLSGLYCQTENSMNFTDYVNPFLGTGGHGHTYPGASLPFGMIQLSPDTRLEGWDGCSGYHYSDSVIYGFTHTHLSGTGVLDYGDILLMPTIGKVNFGNGFVSGHKNGYSSKFSHNNERAKPGYYSVILDDYGINVELTVTERAGMHKYIFPKSDNANIILDLVHRDLVLDSYLEIYSSTEIGGYRISKEWAEEQHIYFVIQFSKPFSSYLFEDQSIIINEVKSNNIKCGFIFYTEDKEEILIKIGISSVSIEGARKNLLSEIPDWDFEKIVSEAENKWNDELDKIEIETNNEEDKTIFYTALYHTFLVPNIFCDVDGNYRGRDLKIHQTNNFGNYTVFSLWDTYRAVHPLFTLLQQKRTNDFVKTFISQFEQGGRLPIWELAANETFCMIGYHSIPVIVDAYIKGIRDYDVEKIYEAMIHSAEQIDFGVKFYKKYGYIPASEEAESVSKTLEYAYDDWCLAQLAKRLGKADDYKFYIQRAQYYKNIFDKTTGFMRAKMDARWFSPFDPLEVNYNYTEANSWQYSFYVPQDITGLLNIVGGKENFISKLDEMFTTESKTTGREQADITGLIGQYAHGNEPSHHIAYLYNFVG